MRYTDPSGQMKAIVHNGWNELGEFIPINCYLDDITVICTRKDSSNGTPSFDVTSYWLNTDFQYFTTYSGSRVPFLEGYSYNYNDSQSEELSNILNATSSSSACLSYLLKDSKATYVFGKIKDNYELKISKAGNRWIYGKKAHSVAKLAKRLSWASDLLGGLGVGYDINKTFHYIKNENVDSALISGVDVVVDGVCLFCGYPGMAFDFLWNWEVKDIYWYYNDNYVEQVILPEYNLGVLGLPETMPFK